MTHRAREGGRQQARHTVQADPCECSVQGGVGLKLLVTHPEYGIKGVQQILLQLALQG